MTLRTLILWNIKNKFWNSKFKSKKFHRLNCSVNFITFFSFLLFSLKWRFENLKISKFSLLKALQTHQQFYANESFFFLLLFFFLDVIHSFVILSHMKSDLSWNLFEIPIAPDLKIKNKNKQNSVCRLNFSFSARDKNLFFFTFLSLRLFISFRWTWLRTTP